MNQNQILKRIDQLILVHAYTNINNQHLTDLQRVCLSQERAAWMTVLDEMYPQDHEPRYKIPNHLELTLKQALKEIEDNNWIKPDYEKDPY